MNLFIYITSLRLRSEQIKQIPDQLEARISEKRFLSAVDCLHEGLHLARGPETENIGALSDVKLYLSNQEHALTDILIEELHNHLYLKSPYCEERWTAYTKLHQRQGQTDAIGLLHWILHTLGDDRMAYFSRFQLQTPLHLSRST